MFPRMFSGHCGFCLLLNLQCGAAAELSAGCSLQGEVGSTGDMTYNLTTPTPQNGNLITAITQPEDNALTGPTAEGIPSLRWVSGGNRGGFPPASGPGCLFSLDVEKHSVPSPQRLRPGGFSGARCLVMVA